MNGSVAGFFSYAHTDNVSEQNRIRRLAELVSAEYSLTTGQDLTLFTDRTDPRWADEWHERVRAGTAATTFFVPIITPRYFRQPDCRAELVEFTCRARALGAAELVMPIVYTHTRELADPTSADDAVALVRRMRHEKWQDLRTDSETSVAHRRAVCRLVARLAAVVEQTSVQHNESRPGYGAARTLDIVSALGESVPRWRDGFGMVHNAMTRIDALTEKLSLEMANTPFDHGNAIGRLAILRTYADEITKPAQDVLMLGRAFADEVIQLDPSILLLLHRAAIGGAPTNGEDFVDHCCSLIQTTMRRLRRVTNVVRDYGSSMNAISGLSEILDDPVNDVAVGVRSMLDGIALISEWEQRLPSPGGQTE
jgi:hypothetical protein